MSFEVPVIDLSAYRAAEPDPAACAGIAERLDSACRTVGFVQITGHGIPGDVIDALACALDDFFALPPEHKQRYRRPPGDNRGYAPPKSESLSMSLGIASASPVRDFYEAITVGVEAAAYPELDLPAAQYAHNSWPDPASFRPAVERYFEHAQALSRTLLRAFTDALRLPPGYFDTLVDHSIEVLKMNNYALPESDLAIAGELTGMGAHTDFGILTILWADRVPGLQMLDRDGAWHDVQPAPGALLVNLGDAMARWTNDRWLATVHRVDPPVQDGRIRRRRSAAFFFDGNHDAVIETLPGCLADGETGYPPITIAANIVAKLAGMKSGVAPVGLRETERVRAAGMR
ncbi:isopenicillin N synthase family dioxygenase [Nocardia sp. alder85J]|uniref:isopenicillin N synthase family dioxygenase n=1 Tax=Nocardia sp. alder85J TaxID=2862949 RepID=UPI001CD592E3|nr:2-oxoglutarate and iron-dependent oxygenase domain-containing protein [Nocardia sp. alder85J]MCX4091479.1 isopenicillin N synthase family oxygenase [Nocardia sp. alder85J]